MAPKLVAALLLVVTSGCRMCSDSCDYSPPVAGSPYSGFNGRAGSASNGTITTSPPPAPPPALQELPEAAPEITPPAPLP